MAKQLKFYSGVQQVMVVSNGVPLAIEAEVEITLRRPVKQRWNSDRGWNQIESNTAEFATVHDCPAGVSPTEAKKK